jgi:hypothetical protein
MHSLVPLSRCVLLLCLILCAGFILSAADANIAGTWIFPAAAGLRGAPASTPSTNGMVIRQNGTKISSTLTVPRGGESPIEGTISGNHIAFTVSRHTVAGDITVDYKGTMEGASMQGTYRVRGQETGTDIHWTAERAK